jgi:ribosomal protein S18 acetylase RimI-like enzyme
MGEEELGAVDRRAAGMAVDDRSEVPVCVLLAHGATLPKAALASVALVIEYAWRGPIDNAALNALHADAFGHAVFDDDWAAQTTRHSLGWVTAHDAGQLVGFLNVPWDGGVHAWLQDVIVSSSDRHRGIGKAMVAQATEQSRAAGCEWLHVDFDEEHREFYIDACGFKPAPAGLIEL